MKYPKWLIYTASVRKRNFQISPKTKLSSLQCNGWAGVWKGLGHWTFLKAVATPVPDSKSIRPSIHPFFIEGGGGVGTILWKEDNVVLGEIWKSCFFSFMEQTL